jgi:hypothetical protein
MTSRHTERRSKRKVLALSNLWNPIGTEITREEL